MEKPKRSANKASIISFLPKRRSFAGDSNAHAHLLQNRRGFSGPIVSIVPVEVRLKGKYGAGGGFEEPTSPKVTCMGQVKLRKMRCNSNRKAKSQPPAPAAAKSNRRRGASLLLGRMFRRRRREAASVSASADEKEILRSNIIHAPAPAPALGKMRQFASGRDTLRDFDWRKMVAEGEGTASTSFGEEEYYDEDDEVLVAHSAPLIVGSGGVVALEPKKEVNLWKRRTMPAPNPLQLK